MPLGLPEATIQRRLSKGHMDFIRPLYTGGFVKFLYRGAFIKPHIWGLQGGCIKQFGLLVHRTFQMKHISCMSKRLDWSVVKSVI